MKIAYIGGGSAYAPGVLRAMSANPNFSTATVALVDIDLPNLELITRLGKKIAGSMGSGLQIVGEPNRREALEGADFVFTSFRAGGFQARALDEQIPLRYGVIGQETVGPGGYFFALRNMRVIRELCAEIEELCPDAWLVNYANPTNIIGEAVARFSSVKMLALCDGGKHDAFAVAHLLGYAPESVEFRGLGLNHATWSTHFTIEGRDGVQMMDEAYNRVIADEGVPSKWKRMFRLARRYRRLPNEYLQYYYYPEETVAEAIAAPATRAQAIMRDLPDIFAHYAEQAASERPMLTKARGGTGFGDFAVDIIEAVATDSGLIEMLNVPNRGAFPALTPERVAEVPCRITRNGAEPLQGGTLPPELSGLILALAEYQSLAADVAWNAPSRKAGLDALAANPLVWKLDADRIESLYDEMAYAHREYIPPELQ